MKTLCLLVFFAAQALLAQPGTPAIEAARRDFFPPQSQAVPEAPPLRDDVLEPNPSGERKSVGLAAVYSFLLPGMGELYVGEYGMGKYFTIAEGALWITLAGVDRYANSLQDDSRRYAALHAGTAYDGKDDQYFIDISNFNTVYEFNEQVLRDRDPQKLYDPMSPMYWSWDSDLNRSQYRDQRVLADKVFNSTRFIGAAIAVNHIVSAINAARLAFAHNRGLDRADLIDVRAGLLGTLGRPDGIAISVSRRF